MVSASGPEAAFTVVARDRALKLISDLNTRLASTVTRFGQLASIALRATAVLQGMALILPFVAGLISTLIAGATIPNMIEFAVASRRARIQLQFMGLDATNARAAVESFSAALDRATATSLLQNADAIAGVSVAGADLAISLGLLAKELSDLTGLDVTEVFNALIQARLFDNVEPLLRLVGAMNALGISLGDLADKSPEEIIQLLMELLSAENVTHAEELATAMERLSAVTLPLREAISELVIAFLLVLITSLEERINLLQDDFRLVVLGALTGAMLGAGGGLGGMLAGAIIGALATALILDFNNTMDTVFENPLLVSNLILAAIILGKATGRGFIAGIVLVVGIGLLPGLKEEFDRLSRSDQVGLTAFLLGTALALAFRVRFIAALGLGAALQQVATDLLFGKEGGGTRTTFGLIGAAIGAAIGGGLVGGVIGFFAGSTLFDLIRDTGWFRGIEFVFAVIDNIATNALNAIARTTIRVYELHINAVIAALNLFIEQVNRAIRLLSGFTGRNFSGIPTIPEFNVPDRGVFDPEPFPTFRQPRGDRRDPGIPGFPGFDFPALPDDGRQRQPEIMTINLILDRKVIATVAVDAVRREFKFKSGIVSGFAI